MEVNWQNRRDIKTYHLMNDFGKGYFYQLKELKELNEFRAEHGVTPTKTRLLHLFNVWEGIQIP